MPDYSNGKIYKIVNTENDIVYIGSTTRTLARRMSHHRCYARDIKKNGLYPAMRQLGVENFEIVLIKDTACENRSELEVIENSTIRKYQRRGIELYNLKAGKGTLAGASRKRLSRASSGEKNYNFGKRGALSHNFGKTGEKSPRFKRGSICTDFSSGGSRWVFQWHENKKKCKKSFSILKNGYKGAYKLAKKFQDEIYPLSDSE